MRRIVRIKFGSHLFGTATPLSDIDYKAVFVPAARDILLQRVKGTHSTQRPKAEGEKNYAGEIDEEAYSLQKWLGLVADGQTVALDMLFAPDWALTEPPAAEWREIAANRHRLLTRKAAAFVGYCRQQANKYGIKGSRVAASREALRILESALAERGTTAKLGEIEPTIAVAVAGAEHMALLDIEGATDVHGTRRTVRHWEVCNRKMPLTQTIKASAEIMRRLVNEYGHRALQAERQEGVDWKALSHAVRVATEAIELLETGTVTFPAPNAAHLLDIKTGKLPYQQVAEEIDNLLPAVEGAAARSPLPDEPDRQWIDDFVASTYRSAIFAGAL